MPSNNEADGALLPSRTAGELRSLSPVFGGYRGVGAIRRDAQMMSIRTFLVDAAGVPRPCSAARFERLWKGDPRERLLGHQGALAQFADVFVELVGGLPRRILQID